MHKSYSKLLFFSVSKVLSLHTLIKDPVFSADKMIQEIGFLFENSPTAIELLKRATEVRIINRYVDVYLLQMHKHIYLRIL